MSGTLEALQRQFAAGVLGDAPAILHALRTHGGFDAAQRFEVYRHAYRARLVDALTDSFAHSARYLGEAEFRARALEYVEAHSPRAYSIRWYGAGFPAWLRKRHAQDAALAELAALDWALRAAFDSADAAPLEAAAFAALSPADWARVGFRLHPSFRLLRQRWNAVSVWQAINAEASPPAVRALPQAVTLAVWRHALQPHFRTLEPDEGSALRALRAGASFAAVCARLAETRTREDAAQLAGRWLRRWVDERLLVALR